VQQWAARSLVVLLAPAKELPMRHAFLVRCAFALVLYTSWCSAARADLEPTHGAFTASDGVKIHYLEAGAGSPVVLIHGYTGTAEGNWFSNGVAEALAKNHRVVAIDCRGHGKSDKPHDATKYGKQMVKDVVELMDQLKISKAHIHGYSMGGFIVSQLLVMAPERFITASFGGSGVPEVEERYKAEVPKDEPGGDHDPQEKEASGKLQTNPDRDAEALAAVRQAWDPRDRGAIDLTKITIPVLAINGEFDMPVAKTHRMQRELKQFTGVVLPGKSHLTAIMQGYIPPLYIDSLVEFINANDSHAKDGSK
jgi:pimeloyl-ACP methyl ester carboxylesterase